MKKCLLLGLMVLSLNCFSQNRNSIWCFGDSSGIDFNNINNPVAFASGMDGRGSCTSIADSSGQLLFYANTIAGTSDWSTVVFNSNHQLMENGDTIIGDSWQNELVIIPNPGTTNEYYLFSMGETSAVPQKRFFLFKNQYELKWRSWKSCPKKCKTKYISKRRLCYCNQTWKWKRLVGDQ